LLSYSFNKGEPMKKSMIWMAIMASITLSACGGGGGGSDSTTSNNNNTTNQTTTTTTTSPSTIANTDNIALFPTKAVTTYTATGNIANDSLGWLNNMRSIVGVASLTNSVPALTQASQSHSDYLVENTATGHNETQGLPGFTGADPGTRIQAAYPTNWWGEVVITWTGQYQNTTSPVELLFDAPFHRALMLADFAVAGPSYDTANNYSAMNMDLANYVQVVPSNQFVAYPYDGQTNAKTSWYASESPNPFADATQYENTTVGYPVTLQGHLGATVNINTFLITDSSGNNVSCHLVDSAVNSEADFYAMCVPYAPLSANTKYTVNVTGQLDSNNFNVSWSFTTGAVNASPSAASGKEALRYNINNTVQQDMTVTHGKAKSQ
jgi:hypothetical protein